MAHRDRPMTGSELLLPRFRGDGDRAPRFPGSSSESHYAGGSICGCDGGGLRGEGGSGGPWFWQDPKPPVDALLGHVRPGAGSVPPLAAVRVALQGADAGAADPRAVPQHPPALAPREWGVVGGLGARPAPVLPIGHTKAEAPQNGLCGESTEDYGSTAVPGLENQAAWNPNLIPKQEKDCKEEAKPAQAWVQGAPPGTDPDREDKPPKDAVHHCHSPRVLQESQGPRPPRTSLARPRRKGFGEVESRSTRPPRRSSVWPRRKSFGEVESPGRKAISQVLCWAKEEWL
ncbi:uncharacterized protein LOC129692347 [Psammomys obesus]|uniref:uncharacterized protein LOC129692347 n=1 Tax=Psammomys obesus TaxID=48139 RepID=UPI002452A983|nr:uncharacterized protein LOC129692347 [Psammomys obesus]